MALYFLVRCKTYCRDISQPLVGDNHVSWIQRFYWAFYEIVHFII